MAQDMIGLADALDKWTKQLESVSTKLNFVDRQSITQAEALVFKDHLENEARKKHYSGYKRKKKPHMADDIATAPGTSSIGEKVGAGYGTVVGFRHNWDALNALRTNNGTRFIPGDHWVENVRNNPEVMAEMIASGSQELKRIINSKEKQEGDE